MVQEAMGGSGLPISFAIEALKDRVPDVALVLSRKHSLPVPQPTPNFPEDQKIIFKDLPCETHHKKCASVLAGVQEFTLLREYHLESLRVQLEKSECIAVLPHEPPVQLPKAVRIDSIAIRTMDFVFHLLFSTDSLAATVVGMLREYNAERIIYARGPFNLEKYLLGKY